MIRPRFVAIGALIALAGLIAYLTFGTGWSGSPGSGEPAAAGEPPAVDGRGAAVVVGSGPEGAGAAAGAGDAGTGRTEVEPDTVLTGSFVAPTGSWPGGGIARLVPRADPPDGGMMGMFSAGMELAREGESGERTERGRQLEQRMIAWLGRAEAIATAGVDLRGHFEFRNPRPGGWAVELHHDSLRHRAPTAVDVVGGERRDAGEIETELCASVLVVVSDVDGQPIERAAVQVAREMDPAQFMDPNALRDMGALIRGMIPLESKTDDNGRCELQGLDLDAAWKVVAEKDGFVAGFRELRVAAGRQSIVRIELERGARIEVSVRGPDGEPYADARLRLQYLDLTRPNMSHIQMGMGGGGQNPGGDEPVGFRLRTDGDGVAQRAGLPAGRAELRLVTPGFRRQVQSFAMPATGVVERSFTLDLGATVGGIVLDETGAPIEGAHVLSMALLGQSVMGLDLESIVGLDLLTIGAEDRGVDTDADGRFVLGGFEPGDGEVHLAAVAPRFDPARVDAVVGATDVEFQLLRACSVSGRIVDDRSGSPVTSFRVELKQRQFLVMDLPVVKRDFEAAADGVFDVSPAPRQGFELVVAAEGYATTSRTIDLSDGSLDCGEIRLKLPAVIEGETIGPDGAPVAGVRVRVSKGGPADSAFLSQFLGGTPVESDERGRFRIDGLTGRAVRLLADADGYAPLRSKAIRIESGEKVDGVVLELSRGGSIRGEIVDADGRPQVGWQVQAEHASGSSHAFARADEEGKFLLEGLAGGTYKVTGLPADYMQRNQWRPTDPSEFGDLDIGKLISQAVEMSVEDRVVVRDGEESELTLVHDGIDARSVEGLVTVDGDVRVGGASLDEGMVALYPSGSTMPRHLGDVSNGRFHLDRVRPGTYRLQVRAGLLAGDLGRASVVVIPAGPTHALHVDLPGGAIAGRVLDADSGEPAGGVLMMLSRPGGSGGATSERIDVGEGTALTSGAGTFRFDGLEDGVYEVFAKQWTLGGGGGGGGGRSGRLTGVVVGPGEVRDGLEVALERGCTLRVLVRDANGPRANALVSLIGAHGDPLDLFHRTLTDRDGVAEFSGLPNGSYRASVDVPRAAPAVSEPVELRSGDASVDVSVRPGVPVTLRLTGEVPDAWRGDLLVYSVWRADGALLRSGRVTVPAAGALEDAARAGLSVGSYAPGSYRLRVEGARFGVFDEARRVPSEPPAEWTIDAAAARIR